MAIRHLTTNIAGLLRNNNDKQLGRLFSMDGKAARKELEIMQAKGHLKIPSDNCKHFSPVHGCQCRFYENGRYKRRFAILKYFALYL